MLRSAVAFTISAATTLAAYLALLGWDQEKETGPDGYLHGPYAAWQVAAMALTVGVIAWLGGRYNRIPSSVSAATITLTVAWSIDAATDVEDDGLWPLGATMVAFGCALALPLIATLARITSARGRSSESPAAHR
ncbi:hypothetical protein ACIB24_01390 [Spongisporangium articulatum]|uniref:Uncharacterized protein n=1 Tax=Spongisporangium articulatum TaxID=3362603 RepID=A0ABW8AH77_9ACTN